MANADFFNVLFVIQTLTAMFRVSKSKHGQCGAWPLSRQTRKKNNTNKPQCAKSACRHCTSLLRFYPVFCLSCDAKFILEKKTFSLNFFTLSIAPLLKGTAFTQLFDYLGGLSVSVEGPSKAEITCQDNGDGTCRVTYYPMAPGEYAINLKFMDKPIAGSPFVAKVTGKLPISATETTRVFTSLAVN